VIPDKPVETSSSDGTTVEYKGPRATDTVDDDVPVSCAPASKAFFKVGTTPVRCTATDDAGNKSERSFNVTVRQTSYPNSNPDPSQREQLGPRAE
jgi:hypothetical protein